MLYLNTDFLEEFKHLDKICREIYGEESGITGYIDDMKGVARCESRDIEDWNHDLNTLIELRHIRNRLSHEVGTMNMQMCTQEDIDWLRDFYSRILNRTDPVALLNSPQNNRASEKSTAAVQSAASRNKEAENNAQKRSGRFSLKMPVFAACLLLGAVLLLFLMKCLLG